MHHAGRRLAVIAFSALCAAACGDTQRLPAMGPVVSDTLIVYALRGTDVTAPTALSVQTLAVVRATGVFDYDLAFDIDDAGNAVLYPMELLVAADAPFRRVGLRKLQGTETFEGLLSAPRKGYVYDEALVLAKGESVVIEAGVPCQYPYPSVVYGKIKIDSIVPAKRAIFFQVVSDPSCGFRSLVPGELPRR